MAEKIFNKFFTFLIFHIIVGKSITLAGTGLKWVRISVPQYRIPGDIAQLQCNYDLGNDSLYAVKWYKDHEEFYRYVPKSRPETTSYSVDGIDVNMKMSNRTAVVLESLSSKSSGLYRCEVSAEAPSFSSAQAEARMEVVYVPVEDPHISDVEMQYQIGEMVNINCTSGKSHPTSKLYWYINKEQITDPEAIINYPPTQHSQGLSSSTLGLHFTLENKHFINRIMVIKCKAMFLPIIWTAERKSVVQSLPIQEMREAMLLVENSASRTRFVYASFLVVFFHFVSSTIPGLSSSSVFVI